ncbi:phage tail protein I [Ruminiclostridium josui]|uniref:phage tail protein I n=1 Tax=Ruminiclostridium josui TaxID=1499 RepID=UPI000466B0FB|nr:phage tail protein I [Ruminiclostridium josui]
MQLGNIDLLKLQTKFMLGDKTTQGFCAALTPQLQGIAGIIKNCMLLARVQELPEAVLDALAHELLVDWYDATADISIKRELIKNSDKVHMYMGTPYSVEQVVQDYFGDGYVEEWFQYDGEPFHFRVVTSNSSATSELAERFTKAIEKVKRKSTVLDQVIVEMAAELPIYYGNVLHIGDVYTVEQVV